MSKIVISEFMDQVSVDILAKNHEVIYDKTLVDNTDKLLEIIPSCDAIIVRNRTQVKGKLLEAAKDLKAVGRLGVGLDNIDITTCKERGINVIPATGANNISVAEYVFAGLLNFARGMYNRTDDVKNGLWPRENMIGCEITGKTLGLIGFGGIARDIAKKASAFQMDIISYDPYIAQNDDIWQNYGGNRVKPVTLSELLQSADAISLHVPLVESTKHLINAENIALMKENAILINTSRGGIVDESALAAALSQNKIKGAMMDVFEKEPLPANSPLADVPNCILTPHIAGVTLESNTRISAMIAEEIHKALS